MMDFISQHQFGIAVAVYWIYSAAVSALPDPVPHGSPAYLWLYRFSHTIAGNIFLSVGPAVFLRFRPIGLTLRAVLSVRRLRGLFTVERSPHATTAFDSRIPGLKILGLVVVIPLLLVSATSCSVHYQIHPGALNATDSAAYDALLIAEATIDQARLDLQAGQLPAEGKSALDALIRSYNLARAAWLTYRGAITTDVSSPVYFDQLTKNLSDLTDAIRNFERVTQQ